MHKYTRMTHQTFPFDSIKPNPISDETYLNLLDTEFYQDPHQIVLSSRYQQPKCTFFFFFHQDLMHYSLIDLMNRTMAKSNKKKF